MQRAAQARVYVCQTNIQGELALALQPPEKEAVSRPGEGQCFQISSTDAGTRDTDRGWPYEGLSASQGTGLGTGKTQPGLASRLCSRWMCFWLPREIAGTGEAGPVSQGVARSTVG